MTKNISIDAEIDRIRLADQVADPASPAAGYKYFYAKAGGLYAINSAGAVVGPLVMTTVATDPIFDAAGDIVQGTGPNAASKLAIGTAYQIPRVNAGATALEYASAGRVLISEQTPTGTGTVTWNSIPATYKSLEIEYVARTTEVATQTLVYMYYNNDTTATNYRRTWHSANATSTNSVSGADDAMITTTPGASAPADDCGSGFIKIINYASTTFNKSAFMKGSERNAANSVGNISCGHAWESAVAITRIDLVTAAGNFVAGSTFRLYGVF